MSCWTFIEYNTRVGSHDCIVWYECKIVHTVLYASTIVGHCHPKDRNPEELIIIDYHLQT